AHTRHPHSFPTRRSSDLPKRFAESGDPHAGMDDSPGSLERLLDLAVEDEASGLGDAPWPPHFRKMDGEAPRVAPSRARSAAKKRSEERRVGKECRSRRSA